MCADRYLDSVTGSDADNGTTRALADATLTAALAAMAAGDRTFVEDGHTETLGATTVYTFGGTLAAPVQLVCVDFTGTADPTAPVSADLRTGAVVAAQGGNFNLTLLGGNAYVRGMTFRAGTSTNSSILFLGSSGAQSLFFESCEFALGGTGGSTAITFGAVGTGIADVFLRLRNCTVRFAEAPQSLSLQSARVLIRNLTLAGTTPTTLFNCENDSPCQVTVANSDLSALGSGTNLVNVGSATGHASTIDFVKCKLGAGVSVVTGTAPGPGGTIVRLYNCDDGDTTTRNELYTQGCVLTTRTDVVRNGGASNGVTAFAWKLLTSATVSPLMPFQSLPLVGFFDSAGSKTLTVQYIHGESAALTDTEIWLLVEYLGTSGFPLGGLADDTRADILATAAAQTADSSQDWDNGATARANSTAYSLGDIRRAATPNGRVFIVTTAGTSAGSEPAGFASASDGGSVTDNTVTWRCMRREKVNVTVTVQEVGDFRAWVVVGRPSLSSLFVDPKVTVT